MASLFGQRDAIPAASDIVQDGPITIDIVSRSGTANPFAITTIGDMASKICLDWKVHMAQRDEDYRFAAFHETTENRPPSRNDGVTAFMCFEQNITKKEAILLVKEFSALDPKYRVLNYDIIQKVHQILCENPRDENGEDSILEHKLGERLSYFSLEFFLIICQHNIDLCSDEDTIKEEVKKAVAMAELHEETVFSIKARMQFKHAEIDENVLRRSDFVEFAKMAKETLYNCKQDYNDFEGTVAQQHEAVLGHRIIKGALNKIASFMSRRRTDTFMDQISALSATASLVQLPLEEEDFKKLREIGERLKKRTLVYSKSAKRQKITNSLT
ncbi:hypothetical protein PFICI_00869 [Pestalotiopsis fici W106-1]|uniref:Uncharacterized protein n=1 Tax=Pestalotiopsis fici (strain W106-1 / CGMCC3.15140) TaxID=1229662 RepID=W3XP35_PESFW|nr:uncharacterized protein PFICI_00869 [Pestalotiopsis fici W106-1]ETS87041.1 hypothetical protein PFICI_00869 [Pestalotiopsis fici W106-1]